MKKIFKRKLKMEYDDEKYGIPWNTKLAKKTRGGDQDINIFKEFSEHERVYMCSHIYGGSCAKLKKKAAVYKDGAIVIDEIETPDLLLRFFIEILSNATDNVIKSRTEGVNTECIVITMSKNTISIENGGLPIPIAPLPSWDKKGVFGTPVDMIFGTIGSGSNLDSEYERHTAGTNGIGAKLTNIFSIRFTVECGDNIRGVHQIVEWRRNMMTKVQSTCTPEYVKRKGKWILNGEPYTGPNFTKITYTLDFRKFDQDCYTENDLNLFKKLAIDSSFAVKVPIVFNDERFDFRDIDVLAKLVGGEDYKNRIVIHQLSNEDKELHRDTDKKEITRMIKHGEITPYLEICMICKPGAGFDTSYTNGVYNKNGGVHTNEAYKVILDAIKKLAKEDKSLGVSELEIKLDIRFLKANAILILNFKCVDADFDSQMKYKLDKPTPKISLSLENVNHIRKWKIFEVMYNAFSGKKVVSKKRFLSENFVDANFVGKPGYETTLLLCEGGSAGNYIDEYILEAGRIIAKNTGKDINGRDVMAKLNLTGKIRNISGMENQKIDMQNPNRANIFVTFMNVMGLVDGVDYETEEGMETLRYKKCIIMVDADNDGSHILCLFINFLYRRFPSFLKSGKFLWVYTPIIRAINNERTIKRFYTQREYSDWLSKNKSKRHIPHYFKGLASASPEQAREDARLSPNVVLWFDKEADIYLNIAFDKIRGSSEKRKEWILKFKNGIDRIIVKNRDFDGENVSFCKISDLVNTKLVEYSLETLPRCIPYKDDQLKHSIRILISWMLKLYNFGKGNKKSERFEHLAAGASEAYKYHHASFILMKVAAKLSHNFAGSNNLPFITVDSMTGSREFGGHNAGAPRYTHGRLNWWVKYLIKEEFFKLVEKNIVEGVECEPKMIPIFLPISLINETRGVSSGWSTRLRSYHPKDVLTWIYRYISGKRVFPMIPWFKGFTGNVTLEYKKRIKKPSKKLTKKGKKDDDDESDDEKEESDEESESESESEQEEEEEEEDEQEEGREETKNDKPQKKKILVLKIEGEYEIIRQYKKEIVVKQEDPENYGKFKKVKVSELFTDFIVNEVPIGIIPNNLMLEIAKKCDEPPKSRPKDSDSPCYFFEGYRGKFNPEDIGMVYRCKMTNINLISSEGIPITYDNIYQVLVDYCENMKELFEKHKRVKMQSLEDKIEEFTQKAFLIKKTIDKEWTHIKKPRDQVKRDLKEFKILYDVFNSIKGDQYTDEGYQELVRQVEELNNELEEMRNKPSTETWKEYLREFSDELDKREEYQKLEKHNYPFVFCDVNDLTTGKILSPYPLE